MRTIYIDSDYLCHADSADGRRPVNTGLLDGYGDVALESVRFIPENETYTAPDGRVFYGLFVQILNNIEKEQKQYTLDMEIINIITNGVPEQEGVAISDEG